MTYLRDKYVIDTARKLFARLLTVQHAPALSAPAVPTQKLNTRVFMTMWLTAHFPTCVFERMGQNEQDVHDRALSALDSLSAMLEAIITQDPGARDRRRILQNHLTMYWSVYLEWKHGAEGDLLARIRRAIHLLSDAHCHYVVFLLRYNEELVEQIEVLRARLARLEPVSTMAELESTVAQYYEWRCEQLTLVLWESTIYEGNPTLRQEHRIRAAIAKCLAPGDDYPLAHARRAQALRLQHRLARVMGMVMPAGI